MVTINIRNFLCFNDAKRGFNLNNIFARLPKYKYNIRTALLMQGIPCVRFELETQNRTRRPIWIILDYYQNWTSIIQRSINISVNIETIVSTCWRFWHDWDGLTVCSTSVGLWIYESHIDCNWAYDMKLVIVRPFLHDNLNIIFSLSLFHYELIAPWVDHPNQ